MRHIRLLFWLKWKLLLRGYRRSRSEWIGAVVLVLVLTPIALGIATWFGYWFLNGGTETENWLRTALLSIYAFWIFIPILGYSLNDTYDITRLFVYPLSMRQIFAGTIAGTLMDRPTILLLPTFVAILIGFVRDPIAAVLTVAALCLFLLHTLALSQAILMAGAGLFQSRKFRDTAVVLLPLIWIVYYMRFFVARQARTEQWTAFVHSPAWNVVNYLPQGLAARAIYAASSQDYIPSILFLAALAFVTFGTFALAGWTLQRIYEGETATGRTTIPPSLPGSAPAATAPGAASGGVRPSVPGRSFAPRWLPQAVRAVADKEFRYLVRDPYYKMILINMVWPLVVPVFIALRTGNAAGVFESSMFVWIGPAMMTFSQMQLCYNIFGTEGGAIGQLFLFPAARREIVLGKNYFHFTVLTCFNLAMAVVVYALSRNLGITGLLLYWMELSLLINLGLGNLFSLYFPMRVVMRGWRVQYRSSGQGCVFFLVYLIVWFCSLLLFVPVAAALAIPLVHFSNISTSWLAVSLPFGALYVAAIYTFAVHMSERLLPSREDPIVAKVSQEPQ